MSHASVLVMVNGKYWQEQIDEAVAEQMAPFDEANEWFRDGSRWDWYEIGGRWDGLLAGRNLMRRSEIHEDTFLAETKAQAERAYREAMAESNARLRRLLYDIGPDTKLEDYVSARTLQFPPTYAVLRNHRWQERSEWVGLAVRWHLNANLKSVTESWLRGNAYSSKGGKEKLSASSTTMKAMKSGPRTFIDGSLQDCLMMSGSLSWTTMCSMQGDPHAPP